jgi:hypothetical protein
VTARPAASADPRRPDAALPSRRRIARTAAVLAVAPLAYLVVRPAVTSDAAALAVAGALPLGYGIGHVVLRRRVDPWALVSGTGFAVGCLVSLLAGGSALPLKLHEAWLTFLVGVALLGAVLVGRPVPLGRLLKVPGADRRLNAGLGALIGGFLVLHALLHLALAVVLSTPAYLTAGRLVGWATLAAGAGCLYAYLRRMRRSAPAGEGKRRAGSNRGGPTGGDPTDGGPSADDRSGAGPGGRG